MRTAEERDLPSLTALWQQAFGDSPAYADFVFRRFAGLENTFVAENGGQVSASLCAVPCVLDGLRGVYLYGVATRADLRGRGLMTALLNEAHESFALRRLDFSVLIPAGQKLYDFYARFGYATAFYRRTAERAVANNLWAQAEFDTLTAPRLTLLREKFRPQPYVAFEPKPHEAMMLDLYSSGATTVESKEGYGVFFEEDDILYFREIAASGNPAAVLLLEAARQRTGKTRARVDLPQFSELLPGEGRAEPAAMIRWFGAGRVLDDPAVSLMCES